MENSIDNTERPSEAGSALLDSLEDKGYVNGNTTVDPSKLQQPLPQAPIRLANAEKEGDPFAEQINTEKDKRRQAPPPKDKTTVSGSDFRNPDMAEMPPDKQYEAALNLAKIIVNAYSQLCEFCDGKLKISEKARLKLRSSGEVDMDTPLIPVEAGVISVEEFIRIFNEQTTGTISVDADFREEVTPLLAKILAKRGQGLSDEQMLFYHFGTHAAAQVQKFVAQKRTVNSIFAFAREMSDRNRQNANEYDQNARTRPGANNSSPAPESPVRENVSEMNTKGQSGTTEPLPTAGQAALNEVTNYSTPRWGTENVDALNKHEQSTKGGILTNSTITADPPARRRRVGSKKKK